MSNASKITVTEVGATSKKPEHPVRAGNFYRSKTDGALVFIGSMEGAGQELVRDEFGMPVQRENAVLAVTGYNAGWQLVGLCPTDSELELVDVDITIRRR